MSPLASVYNDPAQFGLEILHILEEDGDVLAVWLQKSDGALFYAHDQGRGDQDPFEVYGSVASLLILEPETFLDFEVELDSFIGSDVPDEILEAVRSDVYERLKAILAKSGI